MNSDTYRQGFVVFGDKWKRLSTKPSAQDYADAAMECALLNARLDRKYLVPMPIGKDKRLIPAWFQFFQDLREIMQTEIKIDTASGAGVGKVPVERGDGDFTYGAVNRWIVTTRRFTFKERSPALCKLFAYRPFIKLASKFGVLFLKSGKFFLTLAGLFFYLGRPLADQKKPLSED